MGFFKKLFSSRRKIEERGAVAERLASAMNSVYTEDYFNNRYVKLDLNTDPVLEGCLKMVEGFFLDNKAVRKVESPVNHPINLDQTMDEGLGFLMYCKAFNLGDKEALTFLAYAFSDFLINNNGFQVYKDKQPEYPLRFLTLKYQKNEAQLSVYPFEYSAKVLNYEATFEELFNKITGQIEHIPTKEEFLDNLINSKE